MGALTWPLLGLKTFVSRPQWWLNALLGSAGGIIIVAVLAAVFAWWYWPGPDDTSWGAYISMLSKLLSALVGFLAVVLPFTKAGAGRAVLRPVLATQGILIEKKAAKRSLPATLRYLLLTASWRIFWLIAVLYAASQHEYLTVIVGLWALGHLICYDACDQVLMLRGHNFTERRWALAKRSPFFLAAGALAGLMAGLLGMTVFGWLIWAPAIFVGAALYVAEWDTPATTEHVDGETKYNQPKTGNTKDETDMS